MAPSYINVLNVYAFANVQYVCPVLLFYAEYSFLSAMYPTHSQKIDD